MPAKPLLRSLVLIVFVALLAVALVGCTPTPAEESSADDGAAEASETVDTVPAGDTACDHPYFPVTEGAVLTYSQEAPGASSEMTQEFEITGEDTFHVYQTVTGEGAVLTSEGEWACTGDGLVQTSDVSVEFDIPGIEFSDIEYAGVTLPGEDAFVEGAAWQSTYTAAGTAEVSGVMVEYGITIVQDNMLTGFESVTVPAGTYDAARVDSTETMSVTANGATIPDTVSTTSVWYAEGVGIVRIETEAAGGLFVQELIATE